MGKKVSTLYVRNLNEKVSYNNLRTALEQKFMAGGFQPVEVLTFKRLKLRGQSFVTLGSHEECLKAIELLNTDLLLEKPMDIYLAKKDSDAAVKKVLKDAEFEKYLEKERPGRAEKRKKAATGTKGSNSSSKKRSLEDDSARKKTKKPKQQEINNVPYKVLLLTELPDGATESEVNGVFDKFSGLLNVTLVGVKHLALVEFKSDADAMKCLAELGRHPKVGGSEGLLQFAKK